MSRRGVHRRRASVGRAAPGPASRGFLGSGAGARWSPGIPEVRGPAACMRRDALFRRTLARRRRRSRSSAPSCSRVELSRALAAADLGRRRSRSRSCSSRAKLTGLYDRDETLLRKTTLDEAPKLFQLATLCAARRLAARAACSCRDSSTATRRCSCGSRSPSAC